MRLYRLFLIALYLVSFAYWLRLALDGSSYYLTPLVERPRHELYWELKPGGSRGYLYGVAGSAMMVTMLVYSVRKRWLRRWGALRYWLDFHIYLGVFGPLMVLLHTSFKFGGLVAIAFWSMVTVAVSGILGRYLYVKIPRHHGGNELSMDEVTPEDRERVRKLRRIFHYWHVLHKPFAATMYLLMIVHIVVAWMTGYAWGN